jgi:hypothetical protein
MCDDEVMRLLRRAMALLTLAAIAHGGIAGCGADNDPCGPWTYGGCCSGNQAQFIRTCINPNGSERTERRCSGTCG